MKTLTIGTAAVLLLTACAGSSDIAPDTLTEALVEQGLEREVAACISDDLSQQLDQDDFNTVALAQSAEEIPDELQDTVIEATTACLLAEDSRTGEDESDEQVDEAEAAPDPDGTDATAEPEESAPETTETPAEQEPTTTSVEAEDPPASAGPLASVGRSGLVTYEALGETWANIGAEITNNSTEDLFFVEVTYNVIGADGTPVTTESSFLEVIPAGETVIADTTATTDLTSALPVTVEINVFAEEDSFITTDWAFMEVGPDITINNDGFLPSVSGTVTNPTNQVVEFFSVDCLLLTADGTVTTAVSAFADQTAPGQTIAWETSGSEIEAAIAAGATTAECTSIATLD